MKIVMTGSASDPLAWQDHIRNKPRREALAKRFKNPQDPLKIVLVRDMWLTGFDAPSLHTMYVDKPMRGHGLMQAIARVNRVFSDKPAGLVVDYIGIAQNLKSALAQYAGHGGEQVGIDEAEAVRVLLEKYEIVRAVFRPTSHVRLVQPSELAPERTRRQARLVPSNHCRRMRAHCCGAPFSGGIDTRTPTDPGLAGVSQRLTVAHRPGCEGVAIALAGASAKTPSTRTIEATRLLMDGSSAPARMGSSDCAGCRTEAGRVRAGRIRVGRRGAPARVAHDLVSLAPLEGHDAAQELGIDDIAFESANPALIRCSLTGFGQEGPRATGAAQL
jgi:hypothetical protein